MPATSDAFKAILLAEIRAAGDARTRATTDAILVEVFDDIWSAFSDAAVRSPQLQYLYAKRQVIAFWKSSVWRDVDYEDDVDESLSQMGKALDMMDKAAEVQITALEAIVLGASGSFVGQMTTKTPLAGVIGQADPNAPIYRGDPRYRNGLVR